jgi:hypothetical protein
MAKESMTVEEARDRLLERRDDVWDGGDGAREEEEGAHAIGGPVSWSQSFPDPTTHPEEAKSFAIAAINRARQESARWEAIATGVMAEAFVLLGP